METLVADQGIMTLVTVVVIAICAALALYTLYSVIWRAVRRGLQEFTLHQATPQASPFAVTQTPVRSMRLHIPARAVKVPDYLPSDWS